MDFQKVADAIEKSLPEIKDLLFSEEIGKFLNELAQKNELSEEVGLKMIDEVGYVILGLKERSSLKNSLYAIGIDKGVAFSIIQDVSRKIFTELDKIEKDSVSNNDTETNPPIEPVPSDGPIIITQETKTEALEDLSRRSIHNEIVPPSVPPPSAQGSGVAREIVPANLPMIEPGEVAHEVPHVEIPNNELGIKNNEVKKEQKIQVPVPNYGYDKGKDPYREPLI